MSAHPVEAQTPTVTPDVNRRSANFSPSIWGDHFLSYSSLVQELKEEVRRTLMAPVKNPSQKLDFIDNIQRLGVSYHFEDEIYKVLEQIHRFYYERDELQNDDDNLYTTALCFRLLRQQGYNISCGVFNKFKNGDGKFKEALLNDVPGLLSLYEATHLRTHGEDILDEALTFTTTNLESTTHRGLSPSLSKQVTHALHQPLWKGLPRLEARHYMSIYQERDSHDETLLTFAKLDFNLLQQVHQKELSEITRWWKELDTANKLSFARDRVVECYFWILGVHFEPQYYPSRMILSKVIALTSVIDDIYDVYGTFEELVLFTEAIERWDISAINQLPEYMKVCYQELLGIYSEIEESLANEGKLYRIHYAREAFKVVVRAYFQEAKWFHQKYTPTLEEYKSVALVTTCQTMFATMSFIAMGDIVTKDTFNWLFSDPKILKGSKVVSRFMDDMVTHKFEQERGHVSSAVECYMIEHGASEEEAITELTKQLDSAWSDMNEGWIDPTAIPLPLLVRIINLARVIEVIYKCEDGYANSGGELKGFVASLLVEHVPA
ncbi:putative lyase [Rosa chinensis]|uniref:Putative lyase n=1 Tax=Rosa chinensis TaxID=74649 RepID=A0A2P6QBS5_ROSCH|nr:putative lyase [Rosa chinensis]